MIFTPFCIFFLIYLNFCLFGVLLEKLQSGKRLNFFQLVIGNWQMIDFTSSLKNAKHVLQCTCYVHKPPAATASVPCFAHQCVQSGAQTVGKSNSAPETHSYHQGAGGWRNTAAVIIAKNTFLPFSVTNTGWGLSTGVQFLFSHRSVSFSCVNGTGSLHIVAPLDLHG